MKKKILILGVLLFTGYLVYYFVSVKPCNDFRKQKLDFVKEVSSKFNIGDSRQEIESILDEHNIIFSYDRFNKRYQGVIRFECDKFSAITIHTNLNEEGNFESFEYGMSYTTL